MSTAPVTRATTPQEIVERAIEACAADSCTVLVEDSCEVNLRWANNGLTTDGLAHCRDITVVARIGDSVGTVSYRGAVEDHLAELVAAAERAAREATPAPDAQPEVAPRGTVGDWSSPVPGTSVEAFGQLVPALADAFARARSAGHLWYGYAEHGVRTRFLARSGGLRCRHDQPTGHLELTARDSAGSASAWAGTATRDFRESAVHGLSARLREGLAAAARRRVELPPGRYECLLPPPAVADLMNYVNWSASAQDALDGRTVYSRPGGGTRVGERLTDAALTLCGDPYAPGLECTPFVFARASDETVSVFDNGLPVGPTTWIDDGVLDTLVTTRHSAARLGVPVRPHVDNLILRARDPAGPLDRMIAASRRALLVTSLWYIREVDPRTLLLTGLTRDGVYLVEDGEIVGAVNNFRFNESPVDLLRRVVEAGTTVPTRAREWGDAFTATAMPTLRVADFTMSSVSRAT